MVRTVLACVLGTVISFSLLAQNTAPQVTVWLYRPSVDNFSSAVTLYLDGRKLVNLGHGQFFGIHVSPGLHAFNWTNQPGARPVVVPVGPDPQAYLEVTFVSAFPFLSFNPLPVDKGMQTISGLQPINPNGVFDSGVIVPAQALQALVNAPSTDSTNTAKPAPTSVPAQKSVAATSSASVPQIPPSNAVKLREKTPKEDVARNLHSKTEKETLLVKAVTHESNVVTTPGNAEVLCSETATTTRSFAADNVNCNTTYNPPQQHKLFRSITDKVQAENGLIYTISCTAHWLVSTCGPMIDGDNFKAEVDKKTMWIIAHKKGNIWEEVRIKYKILDIG